MFLVQFDWVDGKKYIGPRGDGSEGMAPLC
jgi:hypothetical protein